MFAKWLRSRFDLRAAAASAKDLERFVASLRGQSEAQIALLVAVAAAIRVRLRDAGHLPDDVFRVNAGSEYEQATVQRRLGRLVHKYQNGSEYVDAAGAMVWIHTLRALDTPELHVLGRQMWQQLERGFPHAADAVAKVEALTGRPPPPGTLAACEFMPTDFGEP
jgi:hypothetical protein